MYKLNINDLVYPVLGAICQSVLLLSVKEHDSSAIPCNTISTMNKTSYQLMLTDLCNDLSIINHSVHNAVWHV